MKFLVNCGAQTPPFRDEHPGKEYVTVFEFLKRPKAGLPSSKLWQNPSRPLSGDKLASYKRTKIHYSGNAFYPEFVCEK